MVTSDVTGVGNGEATLRSSTVAWDDNGKGWCEDGPACAKKGEAVKEGAVLLMVVAAVIGGLVGGFVLG